ncbi:hypothetical protein BDN70DRAFT_247926 [Pholiota conissans]|uniref:Uncharacterized protein n=1 Tax=Pholiota conissans TaxID=109636 RepID=A0A9P5YX33_9AGAR|nr:hypothetical protein BDN70DRAFT_247926 [Pholiota conissans]
MTLHAYWILYIRSELWWSLSQLRKHEDSLAFAMRNRLNERKHPNTHQADLQYHPKRLICRQLLRGSGPCEANRQHCCKPTPVQESADKYSGSGGCYWKFLLICLRAGFPKDVSFQGKIYEEDRVIYYYRSTGDWDNLDEFLHKNSRTNGAQGANEHRYAKSLAEAITDRCECGASGVGFEVAHSVEDNYS